MKENSFINKIGWYVRLIRLQNLVILAICQYFVRYGIINPVMRSNGFYMQMGDFDFALLVFSTLLITAAGYVINDYFDLRIDQVNKPEQIVLQKHIPLRRAIWLHYALTIPGCLIGIYVSYQVGSFKLGFIHIVFALALWYYSLKYKRIPFAGNITVALLAALSIMIIWLYEWYAIQLTIRNIANLQNSSTELSDAIIKMKDAVRFESITKIAGEINRFVFGTAFFAFLINIIREMIKDIEDIEGDKSFRCRTLPIVYGIPVIRKVILVLSLVTLILCGFTAYKLFDWNKELAGWYFSIVVCGFWIYFIYQMLRAKNKKDYHFLSNILKIIIIAGILSLQLLYTSF